MAGSMKDALKRALKKRTLHLPNKQPQNLDAPRSGPGTTNVSGSPTPSHGKSTAHAALRSSRPSKPSRFNASAAIRKSREERKQREDTRRAQVALEQLARAYGGDKSANAPSRVSRNPWQLVLDASTRPHPFLLERPMPYPLLLLGGSGNKEQPNENNRAANDVRELVIGLDFGTCNTKVVVGDRAATLAFAVPFSNVDGPERYLLPTRLWEADGAFSLHGGTTVYRNLKLSLLAIESEQGHIAEAAGFMALVIRHTRSWLFSHHADVYGNAKIVWRLAVGIPAESYEPLPGSPNLAQRFLLAARAGWLAAAAPEVRLTKTVLDSAVGRAEALDNGATAQTASEEAEIVVVPELSAQIYGFLRSDQFDRYAHNTFMVVDIGAGTVDSALFHVALARHGRWNFEFYTTHVQQNGVVNLHRTRVQWWLKALKECKQVSPVVLSALRDNALPTDYHGTIPEALDEYLIGSRLTFSDRKLHPDNDFYRRRVVAQVRGATLYRARDYLDHEMLAGIPMFVCGGGARMAYYRRLGKELESFPGVSWLFAVARTLVIPDTLQAPHLRQQDFDRLSVAFGLSFIELGSVVRALPKPRVPPPAMPERPDRDDLYPK